MRLSTRLVAFLAVLGVSCAPPPEAPPPVDLAAEQAAVAAVLDQFDQMWVNEDLDLLSRIFAHDPDMVNFGTDAAEIWVGYDALRASMVAQFEAYSNTQVTTHDRVIRVHGDGAVAWFSQLWDVQVETGGEAVVLEGMRCTGVLEKRDGAWLLVHIHASVPVSGQAMTY